MRSSVLLALLSLSVPLFLSSCGSTVPPGGCKLDRDCPTGAKCENGVCVTTGPQDASAPDGSSPAGADAGQPTDASQPGGDTGGSASADSGEADSGNASGPDAAPAGPDAAGVDAGDLPMVTVITPAPGAVLNLTAPAKYAVTGTATGKDVVATIAVDNAAAVPLALSSGSFSYDLTLLAEDLMPHKVVVTATNGSGDKATVQRDFSVDRQAPALNVTNPTEGQLVSGSTTTLQVTGTASDKELDTVEATLDGTPLTVNLNGASFGATVPVPATEDGVQHTLFFTAKDKAGNQATLSRTYLVDRLGPIIKVTSPQDHVIYSLKDTASQTVTGTVTDSSFGSMTSQLDSNSALPVTIGASGDFSIPLSLSIEDWTDHALVLTASDTRGNTSTFTLHFTVDRVAPVINIVAPTNGQIYNAQSANPSTASGTVTDLGLDPAGVTSQIDSNPKVSLVLTGNTFTSLVPLKDTEDYVLHNFTVVATDKAGNTSSLSHPYFVDRVPPKLSITAPFSDVTCGLSCTPASAVANIASPNIAFGGSYSDGGAVTLSATINGGSVSPTASSGSWSYSWAAPTVDGNGYDFVVTAKDAAGNLTSATRKVWADLVAPTATMLVDQKVLVPRNADLMTYSELMVPLSVIQASDFSPDKSVPLVTSDNQTFRASRPTDLTPYTLESLTVRNDVYFATDRAGNHYAGGSEHFLTETAAPPVNTLIYKPVGTMRMAVDDDGNPLIALWDTLSKTFQLMTWDGVGWDLQEIPVTGYDLGVVHQLDVISGGRNGLALKNTVRVLLSAKKTADPGYTLLMPQTDMSTWTGTGASSAVATGLTLVGSPGLRWVDDGGVPAVEVDYYDPSALKAYGRIQSGTSWKAATTLYTISTGKQPWDVRGTGLAASGVASPETDATAVYYPGHRDVATIDASYGNVAIAGVAQPGRAAPVGPAWLAWSTFYQGSPPHLTFRTTVFVSCSLAPSAILVPWKTSAGSDLFGTGSNDSPVAALDLAQTADRVAIAAQSTDPSVTFASFGPACSGAVGPSTWDAVISDARAPAVAVGPGGTVFKAYVDASSNVLFLAP